MRLAPLMLIALSACPRPDEAATGVHPAFSAGTLANDVALSFCGDRLVALVPASGDGNLDVFTLPQGDLKSSVFLDDANPPGPPAPFGVAADGEGAFVTLREQNATARVTPCDGAVLSVVTPSEAIAVDPPLRLRAPQDADGDGDEEIDVEAMLPRGPQAVVANAGVALTAFTDILEFGLSQSEPPQVGPGFVLRSDDVGVALPCRNPQGMALDGEDVVVSCSGPLGVDVSGQQSALGDGALSFVDTTTLATKRTIDMGRFAPGTPAVVGERIVVGSVVTPRIACLDAGASSLDDATFIDLDGAAVDSIFDVVAWDDARALALQFSTDQLHVIDVATCSISESIAVGPGGAAFRGALALDVQRGLKPIDGAVVFALSSEVVPLSLHEVLDDR